MSQKVLKVKVPKGKSGKKIKVRTPAGTVLSVQIPKSKKTGDEISIPLPEAEQEDAAEQQAPVPPSFVAPPRPRGPTAAAVAQAGLGSEWANSNIDRSEFLEIGELHEKRERNILLVISFFIF